MKAIGHISEATAVAFAPDGTAFVALKTGVIKSFDYNSATGTFEPRRTSTNFADLSRQVNNYWDRGLTGIAVDPQFGTAGHNFVYVNYTYNRDPRDDPPVVPKWGDPGQQYDECPAPATRPTRRSAGCVVMDRVTRLTAVKHAPRLGDEAGSEKELLASGCFQFGSHASGDVVFGPDGKLYASAGDGASFDTVDYGQYQQPVPGTRPTRAARCARQDYRTPGDALGVDGSIVRMDPANGFTPAQAHRQTSWLVAYGQRNPWRLTFRPGTNELWSGDVGAQRLGGDQPDPRRDARRPRPVNRGWPCYEGSLHRLGQCSRAGTRSTSRCARTSTPQGAGGGAAAPYFSYQTRGGRC